ncbi:MAG: hypothetical protein IJP68_02580 [Selenomonadaceae bacterium]|nr:hypothetical protein [Selenomonadaceae bacterium]
MIQLPPYDKFSSPPLINGDNFFAPVAVRRVVEVVAGDDYQRESVQRAFCFAI